MTDVTKKRRRIPVHRPGEVDPETDVAEETGQPEEASTAAVDVTQSEEAVDWRDMALRLRADMDNYRRRQQRLAEEQIAAEKKRLLIGFLGVVDNLDRIIRYLDPANPHQQSIKATYDDMMKLLRLEGVEPIDAVNTPFDPLLHDAVAMVPAREGQAESMLILEEEQKGYRMGDQVLRPARVIVAKRA
ncbi:MAG TPA: nucleotide exchange factor GrpE [Anaerolineae bacterium]|nr:nucleotide exchange factor GrpE [Anaerolineae bacterium]HQI82997.1 nucleotide exchange factor GrpE [Anaerolineae bacterium]